MAIPQIKEKLHIMVISKYVLFIVIIHGYLSGLLIFKYRSTFSRTNEYNIPILFNQDLRLTQGKC